MHARELVELAAMVSAQGPLMIECDRPVSLSSLEVYWTASKCRLDRWGRELKKLQAETPAYGAVTFDPAAAGILEEVFSGEVLTRVWTAVLTTHDRRYGLEDAEIVTRSVLLAHMEARNRALRVLLDSPLLDGREAVRLNRLRRMCERWADMLLGYLVGVADIREFAVDPGSARDFSADLKYQSPLSGGAAAWTLLRLSLREAFRRNLRAASPNADLNARIASGVIACFPSELFDSTGLMRSVWLSRLSHAATDAAGLIEDLFAADATVEKPTERRTSEDDQPITRFNRSGEF